MRQILALALSAAAAPAFAGNVEPVPVEPLILVDPAPLVDWSGGYAGLTAGSAFSDFETNGTATSDDTRFGGGAFVGANFQSGSWVYGGELGLTRAEDIDYGIDLRGRVGYAAGRALPYVAVGYSFLDTDDFGDLEGPNIGLGVDYLVTERIFLGAEVRYDELDGTENGDDIDLDGASIGLRVGFRF